LVLKEVVAEAFATHNFNILSVDFISQSKCASFFSLQSLRDASFSPRTPTFFVDGWKRR
jgi:hypothetical protein